MVEDPGLPVARDAERRRAAFRRSDETGEDPKADREPYACVVPYSTINFFSSELKLPAP